ncbi:Uncharacterised protein [uncultured archaeon]|nr:Uncharacterised protein [uncultured archaeon]
MKKFFLALALLALPLSLKAQTDLNGDQVQSQQYEASIEAK